MRILTPQRATFLAADDVQWPRVLAQLPHDFFHTPAYLRACAETGEGDPLLFLAEAGDAGFLVPLLRQPLDAFGEPGHFDAASPYGYPGPLAWGDPGPAAVQAMDEALQAAFRSARIVNLFARANPFLPTPAWARALLGETRVHGPAVWLDLQDGEAGQRGMQRRLRTTIRHLEKLGCSVVYDAWETLPAVVEAYHATMRRREAPPAYFFPETWFQRLRQAPGGGFHLATSLAPDGTITGGAFFTAVGGLVHYFLTGTREEAAALSPGKLLIDALRAWGAAQGHRLLNLGGGLGARQDSLFAFKRLFSPLTAEFTTFRRVLIPEVHHALTGCPPEDEADFFPAYRRA
ncbi:GNAT family N-acetyltransferase [Mesoterricola sediminis]|uniref:BioF2-like acetyltransferase domain-containing protein n=1 Tax=Mesoterricola sediminis TaxID=2927980 RepID=A0AA48KBJ6_9BACT|nr:GNAT family N-acetyltransferase [Mesoterricola sediminis]BDU75906.1 hypothetical protein METESE_08640 [Mesoterricola sediminis]